MEKSGKNTAETLFEHKKINKCTLGARLQTLRKVEGMSQKELAQKTQVRREYIEALEEGQLDKLPASVYVHGFLRVIATALSTDARKLIALYDREIGIEENIGKKNNAKKRYATGPQSAGVYLYQALFTPRQVISAVSIILILAGIFYLYTVLRSFVGAPFIIIKTPTEGMVSTENEINVEGSTDPDVSLNISGEDVIVGQDGDFRTQVFLKEGVNDIVLRATNRFNKTTERKISVQYSNPQPRQEEVVAQEPQKAHVIIRIQSKRTWIDVRVDGKSVLTQTVEPGFEEAFEGDAVVITSGGGARTMVSYNGGEFEPLAQSPGLVRDVEFTAQSNGMQQEGNGQ